MSEAIEPDDIYDVSPDGMQPGPVVLWDDGRNPIGDGEEPPPRRQGNHGGKRYDEATVAEAIRRRALGWTYADIAGDIGCTPAAVSNWCRGDVQARKKVDLEETRAQMAQQLEALEHEAMAPTRMFPGTKIALEGVAATLNAVRTRALLLGLNAPAALKVEVQQKDARDAELEEMIREARARSANQVFDMNRGWQESHAPHGERPMSAAAWTADRRERGEPGHPVTPPSGQ